MGQGLLGGGDPRSAVGGVGTTGAGPSDHEAHAARVVRVLGQGHDVELQLGAVAALEGDGELVEGVLLGPLEATVACAEAAGRGAAHALALTAVRDGAGVRHGVVERLGGVGSGHERVARGEAEAVGAEASITASGGVDRVGHGLLDPEVLPVGGHPGLDPGAADAGEVPVDRHARGGAVEHAGAGGVPGGRGPGGEDRLQHRLLGAVDTVLVVVVAQARVLSQGRHPGHVDDAAGLDLHDAAGVHARGVAAHDAQGAARLHHDAAELEGTVHHHEGAGEGAEAGGVVSRVADHVDGTLLEGELLVVRVEDDGLTGLDHELAQAARAAALAHHQLAAAPDRVAAERVLAGVHARGDRGEVLAPGLRDHQLVELDDLRDEGVQAPAVLEGDRVADQVDHGRGDRHGNAALDRALARGGQGQVGLEDDVGLEARHIHIGLELRVGRKARVE